MVEILERYIKELDLKLDEKSKNDIIKKTNNEIEKYKNFYDVTMQEATNLKKYYFIGMVLAKNFTNKKPDIYAAMIDFMYDILVDRLLIDNDEFVNRTINKILITILKGKVEEKFGEYGIYFVFNSIIRFFGGYERGCNNLKNKLVMLKKDISEVLNVCDFEKSNNIRLDFEFFDDEKKLIEENKFPFYIYRYMLSDKYKKNFYANFKNKVMYIKYEGEIDKNEIKKVVEVEIDDSILFLDKLRVENA